MTQPNDSFAREARRNLQDGPAAREAERKRENRLKSNPERVKAAQHAVASSGEKFDALKVGDTLAAFGFDHVVVAKRNRKSIVTTGGNKITKRELTGVQ